MVFSIMFKIWLEIDHKVSDMCIFILHQGCIKYSEYVVIEISVCTILLAQQLFGSLIFFSYYIHVINTFWVLRYSACWMDSLSGSFPHLAQFSACCMLKVTDRAGSTEEFQSISSLHFTMISSHMFFQYAAALLQALLSCALLQKKQKGLMCFWDVFI